jgi:type VI secretion system protein VasJ
MSLVTQAPDGEVARLLAPIDSATPAGLFDVEDEIYQAIDQEMVKLGGLQEASIDWAYIEEASCQYLGRQCKHLRVVAHLSVAWLRSGCWARWGDTLAVLAGMVECYWETAQPKPGPKGLLGKRKLVALVIKRLSDTLPRLDRFTYTPGHAAAAQQALMRLQQQRVTAQLDAAALGDLERLLCQHTALAGGAEVTAPKVPAASAQPTPLADVIAKPAPRLTIGNERETRRAVLSMAEFINQQDPYDPAGYLLRRFGLWAHIQTAPQARQGNRTELMAVPLDIAGAYEDAMAGAALDVALLQRIEKSVSASPYWIRGSYLAATLASRLAMGEVAEAIRASAARFVQRMPALQQLCFSDGTAFVDAPCLAWLKAGQGQGAPGATCPAFDTLRAELAGQLETAGMESVLIRLQGMQADFHTPREHCHGTVIAADLLAARGVPWLAQALCAGVARTMQQTTADAWEPEMFQQLQQYAATTLPAEQEKNKESS